MKNLTEMTLEELWQLFPIELVAYNPEWPSWASGEIEILDQLLGYTKPTISHIGSTSIAGMIAKPIIDILVEIPPETDRKKIKKILEDAGYICMDEKCDRMGFNKGYTENGYAEKVFHIHIHPIGDNDEILFRDYLSSNEEAAKEYGRLKQGLLPKFKHDRDGYTSAKAEFISRVLSLAKPKKIFDR